jgi:hypothetical protein
LVQPPFMLIDYMIALQLLSFLHRNTKKKSEWRDFFGQLWPLPRYPNQTSKSSLFRMHYFCLQSKNLRNLLVGARHMSEHSSPPPAEPALTQFSVQLVTHTKVSALTPAGKPTQKNTKDVKSKELSFACTDSNYIGFLCAILDKHNETKYTVSAQCHFPFKYYHTGRK